MWSKRYCVGAVLLAGLWASPAAAQQRWNTFHFGGAFNDDKAATLASWINDTCRPDEMGHIAGFTYQEAPGKPLNLKVYCRQGGTGKLGRSGGRAHTRVNFRSRYRVRYGIDGGAVILGFGVTTIKGLMDPPTGG